MLSLSLSLCVVQVRQSLVVGKQQAEKVKFDPVPVIENEFEGGEDVGKREEDGAAAAGTRDGEEEGECAGEEPESGAVKTARESTGTFVW